MDSTQLIVVGRTKAGKEHVVWLHTAEPEWEAAHADGHLPMGFSLVGVFVGEPVRANVSPRGGTLEVELVPFGK